MWPHHLEPGAVYRTKRNAVVRYNGNNSGVSMETFRKMKVTRGTVEVRLIHPEFMRGCAEVFGATVEERPNGGLWVHGTEEALDRLTEIISRTHRFVLSTLIEERVNGVLRTDNGTYPRIEVHPSNVVECGAYTKADFPAPKSA